MMMPRQKISKQQAKQRSWLPGCSAHFFFRFGSAGVVLLVVVIGAKLTPRARPWIADARLLM